MSENKPITEEYWRDRLLFDASFIAYFWEHVDHGPLDRCWPWTAATFERGYGHVAIKGRTNHGGKSRHFRAHRIAYLLANRTWGDPCTIHSCDNPPCCNPSHLRAGTQKENCLDTSTRKRNPRHRLGLVAAEEIRRLRATHGYTHKKLSEMFDVAISSIRGVLDGTLWIKPESAHVPAAADQPKESHD